MPGNIVPGGTITRRVTRDTPDSDTLSKNRRTEIRRISRFQPELESRHGAPIVWPDHQPRPRNAADPEYEAKPTHRRHQSNPSAQRKSANPNTHPISPGAVTEDPTRNPPPSNSPPADPTHHRRHRPLILPANRPPPRNPGFSDYGPNFATPRRPVAPPTQACRAPVIRNPRAWGFPPSTASPPIMGRPEDPHGTHRQLSWTSPPSSPTTNLDIAT